MGIMQICKNCEKKFSAEESDAFRMLRFCSMDCEENYVVKNKELSDCKVTMILYEEYCNLLVFMLGEYYKRNHSIPDYMHIYFRRMARSFILHQRFDYDDISGSTERLRENTASEIARQKEEYEKEDMLRIEQNKR
jgi:hypothetical protein